MQLPAMITASIESSLNTLISLDPLTEQKLQTLNDRVIAIHFTDIDSRLYFLPTTKKVMVLGGYEGEPDTTLSGTISAFAKRQLSHNKTKAMFQGEIEIKGNMQVGGQFNTILSSINIDWEEHLSHLIGDIAAHSLANTVKGGLRWLQTRLNRFNEDSKEYIQEEQRLAPTQFEVDAFNRAVDKCRDATDRLEARLKRLS